MRISIKALFIGLFITFAGSILFSSVFALSLNSLSWTLGANSLLILSYLSYGVRVCIDIGAGYITAKIAKKEEYLHGVILGVLIWLLSTLAFYAGNMITNGPLPSFDILFLLGLFWTLLYTIAGAFIQKKIKDKKQEETESPLEQKIENLGNEV